MKRTKMLIPSLGLVALATTVPIVATSCTKNKEKEIIDVKMVWNSDKKILMSEEMTFESNQEYRAIIDLKKWEEELLDEYTWGISVKNKENLAIEGEITKVIYNGDELKRGVGYQMVQSSTQLWICNTDTTKIDHPEKDNLFSFCFIASDQTMSKIEFKIAEK